MKRVGLFMLMALLGLCIVSAVPVSATVIYSSGFNTDTDSNGIADGWSALSGSEGSTFWLETSNKTEGAASQGCDPVAWKGIISDSISGVVTGRTYIISYWVTKLSGSTVEIWGDGKLNSYYRTISSSGTWVYVEDTVVASSNSNPAQLAVDGHSAGAGFLIDDLKIEELPSGVVYISRFNADADGNGITDGWSALSGSEGSTFWMETSDKNEGRASQGCDPVPYKGVISDSISGITASQTYTIKYWILQLSGLMLEIWGDGKLDSYYTTVSIPLPEGGWVYKQDLVTASSNSNPSKLVVDGAASGAGFLVDNMKIEEGDTRIALGTLTGQVELLNFSGDPLIAPVRVEVIPHEAGKTAWTQKVWMASNPGTYSIDTSIIPGTYDIAFSAAKWLRKVVANVTISSGQNVVNASLTNGDVNGNNAVTSTDENIVIGNLGKTGDQ